jgi:peroxiredoxin
MIPLGQKAPQFTLKGTTDGHNEVTVSLAEYATGSKALLVMFICNHCPYVKAINQRLAALTKEFAPRGLKTIAICSNDSVNYPEDDFEHLKAQHRTFGFNFPYLVDTTQEVAKSYGAVCTPDFFLFDHDQKLQYRGRLDDNWKEPEKVTRREMADAITALINGKLPSAEQIPSMGCSIKWLK